MGSEIYTRTGDAGTTSLLDGTRVAKCSLRIEACGAIDETNAWLGVALALCEDPLPRAVLEFAGHRLYNCSSITADPAGGDARASISAEDVAFLERAIDLLEERSGAIAGFVLPGGSRAAGFLHVARAVCRRAERVLCSMAEEERVDLMALAFVNRLSDLLFAAARYENAVSGDGDVQWDIGMPIPMINS